MPLHQIYHPVDAFSDKDKQEIAEKITKIYTGVGLPAFYVVVLFTPVEKSSFYVGAKQTNNFVRVVTQHLARRFEGSAEDVLKAKQRSLNAINECFRAYVAERGLEWEINVLETDRDLWSENGLVPPPPRSEAEKLWVKENRAVPYKL